MASKPTRLIDQYLDGALAPEDLSALDEILLHDDEAVVRLTRLADLDFLLAERFADEETQRRGAELLAAAGEFSKPPGAWLSWASDSVSLANLRGGLRKSVALVSRPKPLSLIVAASVMLILIGAMAYIGAPIYDRLTQSPTAQKPRFVGQLTGVFNAKWEGVQIGSSVGSYVPQGHAYVLKSGVIEVTLERGARVVAEGPATVTFLNDNRARLDRGKAVAHVPRGARGFALDTPQAKVVDLGTSFGVALSPKNDQLFIEVFEGSVNVHPAKSTTTAPFTMEAGERVALHGGDRTRPQQRPEFVRHVPGSGEGHPVLVGFYQFEGNAHDDSGNDLHAREVTNVAWSRGYEGRGAAFVGDTNSYIDLPIDVDGQQMPIMTWGAWVNPDVVTHRHVIVSTDNGDFDRSLTIDERRGHESTDVLRFCAHGGGIAGELPSSSSLLPTAGKWFFVAAEYDAPARTVTLFAEDEHGQLHRDTFHEALPGQGLPYVRVGMHASGLSEAFQGTIDNVFIFRGRLDPNQLLTIHRGGASAVLKLGAEFAPPAER